MSPDVRSYGAAPFRVALLHGGPGAPGEMAPVARRLARTRGVIEPLQSAASVDGQVQELRSQLERRATLPVTLAGFSWGAMLSFIFAAAYPALVRKLILVSSGPYEERYAEGITATRLARLGSAGRMALQSALSILGGSEDDDRGATGLQPIGAVLERADAYDPISLESDVLEFQPELHRQVWSEAARLRASGALLQMGGRIRCPVVAIHGDYDPHPAEGVRAPLASVLADFRFVLLERCGHKPWIERQACEPFYALLEAELA